MNLRGLKWVGVLLAILLAACTGSPANVQVWGGQGSEPGQFNEPFDVAVDQQGFVYAKPGQA